jgi:LysM repeat protein
MKLSRRLRSRLPALLTIAALVAAAWGTWLNAGAASSPDLLPQLTATPWPTLSPLATIELPAFASNQAGFDVSRSIKLDTQRPTRQRVDVLRYTVQPGDTVFGIADQFKLKPETILFGNYDVLQDDPHTLRPGQELIILPVDGTYYQWQAGDTLAGVAGKFGADPQDIADWPGNNLDPTNPQIQPGTWLVVPGGTRPFRQWFVPTINRGNAGVGTAFGSGGCSQNITSGAVGTGGFIWPVSNHYVSGNDYWSGHLAIDIAAGLGQAVWAADSGVVVYAGWSNNGYGNMVMIDHGNGWQTLYAHLSQVNVHCGQSVAQGNTIGLAGSTGNSTGPHLHFETRFEGGFVNPWYVLP